MNDFIHPVKQLCKLVCLAPRDCTCISLSPTLFWYPKLTRVEKTNKERESPPPPLPSPTFPWEDQSLQLSPPWHILSGRQWAKSTRGNHLPCYFYTACLPPKKERSYQLEFGSRDLEIYEPSLSHLKHQRSVDPAWGGDWNQGGWFLWTHRDDDGTSKVKVTDFPVPQSCPFISKTLHLWGTLLNDSLLATLVPQKILGRDCAHSGSSSTMTSLRLLVHNDEVLPEL